LQTAVATTLKRSGAASAKRSVCLMTAAFLACVAVVDPLFGHGRTNIVTSLDDDGPGSLRDAIATARAAETISFGVRGTIILTNGELLVTKNLSIAGPGATNLAISALSQARVLEIVPGAELSLSGLTICDGHAPDGAAGTSNSPAGGNGSDGGGIYNAGSSAGSRASPRRMWTLAHSSFNTKGTAASDRHQGRGPRFPQLLERAAMAMATRSRSPYPRVLIPPLPPPRTSN